jgi:hypothetical protein
MLRRLFLPSPFLLLKPLLHDVLVHHSFNLSLLLFHLHFLVQISFIVFPQCSLHLLIFNHYFSGIHLLLMFLVDALLPQGFEVFNLLLLPHLLFFVVLHLCLFHTELVHQSPKLSFVALVYFYLSSIREPYV